MLEVLYDIDQLPQGDIMGVLVKETKIYGRINAKPLRSRSVPCESFDIYAGNNRQLRVLVRDDDLNVIDITGATGVFTVKTTKSATSASIQKSTAVSGEGQIGAADEGEMFFFLVPADTSSLDIRQYVFDVKVTLSNGKAYTVVEGVVNLIEAVN